ncbi:hypothetical protein Y032_0060g3191 [Ancylostoma ceylanicum]|nr:hypothetical protein Y032_0060g3191 [Ancylostoma ceylanicum]
MESSATIQPTFLILAKVAHLTFEIVAMSIYGYMACLLSRKKVYNRNVTALLVFVPIPSIVGVLMYNMIDIFNVTNVTDAQLILAVYFIQTSGMFAGSLNLPNLIIDRLTATLYLESYENRGTRFPFQATAMITIQCLISMIMSCISLEGIISDFVVTMVFTALCIVSAVIFSLLPLVSRRVLIYHRMRHSPISVRYQSVENVRAARLLTKLMICYVTFYISETGIYYFFTYISMSESLRTLLKSLFLLLICVEIMTTAMVITCSHPSVRAALPCVRRHIVRSDSLKNENCNVRSFDGRQLAFSTQVEQSIYFQTYSQMWSS